MNVIFNSIEKSIVLHVLENFKTEKVFYCSGRKTKFEKEELNGIDLNYINYWDTRHGTYHNYDMNDFMPLDQEILDFYASIEVEALYMDERNPPQTGSGWMNKVLPFDKKLYSTVSNKYVYAFNSKTYMERRRVYLRHLRFWNHVFTNTKIDVFIGHAIPHDTSQFIVWKMAEKLGIPYLMISDISVPDYNVIINSDYRRMGNIIPQKIEEIKQKYKTVKEIELSEDFQREWERVCVAEGESFKPWYFKKFEDEKKANSKLKSRVLQKFGRIINLLKTNSKRFFDPQYWYYRSRLKDLSTGKRRYYNENAVKPDLTKKFFYLALHYQPELTSCPKGGVYAHQSLMIEMIAHYLPKDYVLYVKEHPAQTAQVRDFYFYKDLLAHKNIQFVSLDTPSEKLLENCVATVTVAGTVCWEGMAKRKPGLIFGYHPNLFGPGVFPIVTNEDCKKAIDTIVSGDVKITELDLRIFFKALEESTENCHFQMPITKLSDEENAEIIAKAYHKELVKLFPTELKVSSKTNIEA
jgi:hypothetical protein